MTSLRAGSHLAADSNRTCLSQRGDQQHGIDGDQREPILLKRSLAEGLSPRICADRNAPGSGTVPGSAQREPIDDEGVRPPNPTG